MIRIFMVVFMLRVLLFTYFNTFFLLLFVEVLGMLRFFCFSILGLRWFSGLCLLLVSVVVGACGVSLIVRLRSNKGRDYLISSYF